MFTDSSALTFDLASLVKFVDQCINTFCYACPHWFQIGRLKEIPQHKITLQWVEMGTKVIFKTNTEIRTGKIGDIYFENCALSPMCKSMIRLYRCVILGSAFVLLTIQLCTALYFSVNGGMT